MYINTARHNRKEHCDIYVHVALQPHTQATAQCSVMGMRLGTVVKCLSYTQVEIN